MNWLRAALFALLAIALTACQRGGPLRTITQGDQLAYYDFSERGTFEEGSYGDATLRITDNVFRVDVERGDNEIWWAQWGEPYSDVIISAEVEQVTERNENAYGLMCRVRGSIGIAQEADPTLAALAEGSETEPTPSAESTAAADATPTEGAETTPTPEATAAAAEGTPTVEATEAAAAEPDSSYGEGDGYLFLIQGGGSYGIFEARGRNLTPLVNWTASEVINVGPAQNTLRAVCIGDYLAFYINDQLVAEAIDDTYREGQVGMAASAANRLGVRVQFDDLTVFTGSAS